MRFEKSHTTVLLSSLRRKFRIGLRVSTKYCQ
jgi:hypothetical protein